MPFPIVYAQEYRFFHGVNNVSYDILGTFKKSPTEKPDLQIIFKDFISGNPDNISSATVAVVDAQGVDVTSQLLDSSSVVGASGLVNVRLKGGESGKKYMLRVEATMSTGAIRRANVRIYVKEPKA